MERRNKKKDKKTTEKTGTEHVCVGNKSPSLEPDSLLINTKVTSAATVSNAGEQKREANSGQDGQEKADEKACGKGKKVVLTTTLRPKKGKVVAEKATAMPKGPSMSVARADQPINSDIKEKMTTEEETK